MDKELSPLEAFSLLCEHICNDEKEMEYKFIIETALKEKEQITELYLEQCHETEKLRLEHYKKYKALEIIKEKRVDVEAFFYSASCEDYNKHYTHYEDLTQEEYDLLKEVLL